MVNIYLDTCVVQDLKQPQNADLLSKILLSKTHVIYCFSEAHLYDLNRDPSEEKYKDMDFLQTISDNNCYFFKDYTRFEYKTPKEYYDDFDWSPVSSFEDLSTDFDWVFSIFKTIPLNLSHYISTEDLSADTPLSMINLLSKPITFYDFFQAMLDYSVELTNDQKQFKELLKYLHAQAGLSKIYQAAGIEGYDGHQVIDKEKFRDSYAKYFIKEKEQKTRYDHFIEMYYGLEFFGFIKGKPKKQKLMNLINDARHAFFGTSCDILVSVDNDFLNKSRFIYDFTETRTRVINMSELSSILDDCTISATLDFSSMLKEM